jgi:hypothetical protein
MFQMPVLLIAYNRPEHTVKVLDAIKKQKPRKLFVFQDGISAGNDDDKINHQDVRRLLTEKPNWDCELNTYFPTKNLGCGPGPASAITWFFENVGEGIILEDDAVPSDDFFQFAEELLGLYKEDNSVNVIGSMHLDGKWYGDGSYHFSMANRNLCAWATWKRSWEYFDYSMQNINSMQLRNALKKYGCSLLEIEYWNERLVEIKKDCLNHTSWDMQFLMSIWLNQGKGIFPNRNLSTNIGFGANATHTTSENHIAANVASHSILPIHHPTNQKINRKADLNYHKLYFQPKEYGWNGIVRLPFRINKRVKRFLGIKSWRNKKHD